MNTAITDREAARFLMQAAFGPTSAAISDVKILGYSVWIDKQLQQKGNGTRFGWLKRQGYIKASFKGSLKGLDAAVWRKLISSPDELRQRVTHALSEIFVVNPQSFTKGGYAKNAGGAAYLDMLEKHAFGNYRELLQDITLSVPMGTFLNMRGSRKADKRGRAPDENYAREVMQLFSIGLNQLNIDGSPIIGPDDRPFETYTQDEVNALATVFTGWDIRGDKLDGTGNHWRRPMLLNPEYHDESEKNFLGAVIPAGTDGNKALSMALDTIANHPNVGPFIGKQLIQRLVTSNPSPEYVARVATVFENDGNGVRGNLEAVVRTILLDSEARTLPAADDQSSGQLRQPIVRFVHWARAFRASSTTGDWKLPNTSRATNRLGQSPLRAPSVFNFYRPGYVPPQTELAANSLVAPELQITNETSITGYANFMGSVIRRGWNDVRPNYNREVSLAKKPDQLVQHLNLLLAANQCSVETLGVVSDVVSSIPDKNRKKLETRVHATILLIMLSPDSMVQS